MKTLFVTILILLNGLEPLPDAKEEARAQALMRELRCVSCENEPISQSSAPIAEDMRRQVREMIADGKSDTDVRDWFEARYGEFVLFRPKSDGLGTVLWLAPFLLLLAGGYAAVSVTRQKSAPDIEAVEPEDV